MLLVKGADIYIYRLQVNQNSSRLHCVAYLPALAIGSTAQLAAAIRTRSLADVKYVRLM